MNWAAFPEPNFIDRDGQQILADIISDYETRTGRVLLPTHPERILIDILAYRETLVRTAVQHAALQNLLKYAFGIGLDYLGGFVGVPRINAQYATTFISFGSTLPDDPERTFPAGTIITSMDGTVRFITLVDAIIPASPAYRKVDNILARAEATGSSYNGFAQSQIRNLAEPVTGYWAYNLTVTSGGMDAEGDDHYRSSIDEASDGWSCAGPEGAYRFWTKRANLTICDVAVTSPIPGTINIYPLTTSGAPSSLIMEQVEEFLSSEEIRPMSDTVVIVPPTRIPFSIDAHLILYSGAKSSAPDIQTKALTAINNVLDKMRLILGQDIVPSQFIGILQPIEGVYDVILNSPTYQSVNKFNWVDGTATVTIDGFSNG